jgi:hypothetical protein
MTDGPQLGRREAARHPWSEDATVIIDVASLTHRVAQDITTLLGYPLRGDGPNAGGWSPQFRVLRDAALDNLHRMVDVLEHHGVQTGRLLLAVPAHRFPPTETGWRLTSDGSQAKEEQDRTEFIMRSAKVGERVALELRRAGRHGIEVRQLEGYFSARGEHCVDEQSVLAALLSSWHEPGRTVHIVSWDADLTIAPWLAAHGRIMLTRDIGADEGRRLIGRLDRHRPDHLPDRSLPPHLKLSIESLRLLMLGRAVLPEEHSAIQDELAQRLPRSLPSTFIDPRPDGERLVDPSQGDRELTGPIGAPAPRRWFDLRKEALNGDPESSDAAVVVVDSFGLMTTANRADIPARTPTVLSVKRALAPLGIAGELAQLAVIPDIVDSDHNHIALSRLVDGQEVEGLTREALTGPLKDGMRWLDHQNQSAIDSYHLDGRASTISTTSVFGASRLSLFGKVPMALEEKESVVLLAADVLWAILFTELPVIVLSDRADLLVALHVIERMVDPDRRMRERIVRVGMHADVFTGEGIPVARSHETSPWATVMLTARMITDLLRLDAAHEEDPAVAANATDVIAFDPVSGMYVLLDEQGRPAGRIPIKELVRLPLHLITELVDPAAGKASELRDLVTAELELHLDLSRPLPRPTLMRRRQRRTAVRATEATAQVIGHATGSVNIRLGPGHMPSRREVSTPLPGLVPARDTIVRILVEARQDGACTLVLPDLSDLPAELGRPRPATVLDGARARLEVPLDPSDERSDVGEEVRLLPLLGPFAPPKRGDVVLVTGVGNGRVQAVSTPISWPTTSAS